MKRVGKIFFVVSEMPCNDFQGKLFTKMNGNKRDNFLVKNLICYSVGFPLCMLYNPGSYEIKISADPDGAFSFQFRQLRKNVDQIIRDDRLYL